MHTPPDRTANMGIAIERRIGDWKGRPVVAVESTVFVHGLPRAEGLALAEEMATRAEHLGVALAIIGIVRGRPIAGLRLSELEELISTQAPKVNTANLGFVLHRGGNGATTVSTTLELAAAAGLRVVATGGLGGVHRGYGQRLDISSDLLALSRFPVGIVCSGVKSILDMGSTREALETLGIPVIGVGTDRFPAFMVRESEEGVDGRLDTPEAIAAYLKSELGRVPRRGVVIAQPVPAGDEIDHAQFEQWLHEALDAGAGSATGRKATPSLLDRLREVSGGRSLAANLALLRSNAELACLVVLALESLKVR